MRSIHPGPDHVTQVSPSAPSCCNVFVAVQRGIAGSPEGDDAGNGVEAVFLGLGETVPEERLSTGLQSADRYRFVIAVDLVDPRCPARSSYQRQVR